MTTGRINQVTTVRRRVASGGATPGDRHEGGRAVYGWSPAGAGPTTGATLAQAKRGPRGIRLPPLRSSRRRRHGRCRHGAWASRRALPTERGAIAGHAQGRLPGSGLPPKRLIRLSARCGPPGAPSSPRSTGHTPGGGYLAGREERRWPKALAIGHLSTRLHSWPASKCSRGLLAPSGRGGPPERRTHGGPEGHAISTRAMAASA